MNSLDIGEVVRRSGFNASTLRYYEEKGLITSTGRRGLRRLYGPDIIERLSLIALGREAGFSLEEIAGMLAPRGGFSVDRAQLESKAEELDRTIERLSAVRDVLQHVAVCPAPSHLECPNFKRLARIALRRTSSPTKSAVKSRIGHHR